MFFKRLRDLREDADKTQKGIGIILHMNRSVYERYELGQREIPISALISLADYYEVNLDYLVGRTDDSKMLPTAKNYKKVIKKTLRQEKNEKA